MDGHSRGLFSMGLFNHISHCFTVNRRDARRRPIYRVVCLPSGEHTRYVGGVCVRVCVCLGVVGWLSARVIL